MAREVIKEATPVALGKSKKITTGAVYTVQDTDCILLFDVSSSINIELPAVVSSKNRFLRIKFI